MTRIILFTLMVCAGLVGSFLWLLVDEPLEDSTSHWLADGQDARPVESLDFLYLVGMAAPAGVDPVEHGRSILRQVESDPRVRIDLTAERLGDLPCEIEDLDCWQQSGPPWPDAALEANRHILKRWQSFPVYGDFFLPPSAPVLTTLIPTVQFATNLSTLDLVKRWQRGELEKAIVATTLQLEGLARIPPEAQDLLSVLLIDAFIGTRMHDLMLALRLNGKRNIKLPDNPVHHPIDVESVLTHWARRELQFFANLSAHHRWPLAIASQPNRTLNRARRCLEEVIRLANRDALLEALRTEAGDCGGRRVRLRNWHGDQMVNQFMIVNPMSACRAHMINLRLQLATALLEAQARFDDWNARLSHVGAGNPFGPEVGALVREDQICYSNPHPSACSTTCLTPPFKTGETAEREQDFADDFAWRWLPGGTPNNPAPERPLEFNNLRESA